MPFFCLCEIAVQEPSRRLVCIVMPEAEDPVPATRFILHRIIIAVLACLQPPFRLDPLRTVSLRNLMEPALVPEQHGRVIRYGCGYLDGLGPAQEMQGPGKGR